MSHEPKVSLVEIFRSIQGEGFNTGRDALFLRFAGCNLSCVFAEGAVCDTPYQDANIQVTMDVLFEELIPSFIDLRELLLLKERWSDGRGGILSPILQDQTMFILTGGEPLLCPQFDRIVTLASDMGFYVAVETNGTLWRDGLLNVDWISVSPKELIPQGSPFERHNASPRSPRLDPHLIRFMAKCQTSGGEYRYVVGPDSQAPPFLQAYRHYLSPAVLSDGSGLEWQQGFPDFVPGALERCREIIRNDPRWRLSTQDHKIWGFR